ncbi:MAG: hypothetical protein EXS48_00700 [Candidatus Staskawiczbacteria bacterium]|nr:hypothetical protein [Candidatus Staskawiczbacteria bacterium]
MAKLSDYFFFLNPVNKFFMGGFWWLAIMAVIFFVPFLRVWWWVFFPLLLSIELRTLYLWWIEWDYAYANKKWVVLEVITPKEVLVPLKAMEDIFTVMWGVNYDSPNWREKWCEGMLTDAAGWTSYEIVSIEGNLHFYIRVTESGRSSLETVLYGHYPELEIREVPDYTKDVPQDMPNKEWNTYGEDFLLGGKSDVYPIRTYEKFFEPQGEKISAEEKRIDPMSSLLEMMSKLGPGEQFWLQFIAMSSDEPDFQKEAEDVIAELTKRPVKKTKTFFAEISEMLWNVLFGPQKEGSGEKASYSWIDSAKSDGDDGIKELLLSPGEREILTEVENKLKRPVFRTGIRGMYVARRENWNAGHRILTRAYFGHFLTKQMNFISFSKITRPKTKYMFRKSVPVIRSRKMFRNYVARFTPLFPNRKGEMSIFNTEELATLYHFPLKITGLVAPTMARVESKKGGPPPNLPME